MYKIDDVNVVEKLIGCYICIILKIAHTVDNQNFETASLIDTKTHV